VGVILDLATHDLDIMPYLVGERVERVYAEADYLLSPGYEDSISAFLRFPSGTLGTLDVNWVTPCKVRELSVTGECGMITVDYLSQDLFIYQNDSGTTDWERLMLFTGVSEGDMLRPAIAKREPLRVELESFISAVMDGCPPSITGEEALDVLRLASAVTESARTCQPVVVSWSDR
jgi:UDP-N-acetylglucosamine 3-dehydrogenase